MRTQARKSAPKTIQTRTEPITHYFPDDFDLEGQISFALDSLRVVEVIFRGYEPDLDMKESNAIGVLTSWAMDLLDALDLPELAAKGALKRTPRQEEG